MSLTVFNKNNFDFTKEFMFFGKSLNVSRFDKQKFEFFENKNRRMLSKYWVPEEINLTGDSKDFKFNLDDGARHIFTSNLQYQTLLDSTQGRAPSLAFLPVCSIPELEGCIETWSFFEQIHSRSYSHMIRNVYTNPSEVFDKILDIPEIIERAKSVTEAYDDFINSFYQYKFDIHSGITLIQLKEKLFDAVVAVNILEAIRFYVSFACTLAFDKQSLMRGSAKIITLIARDEFEHKFLTQHILRLWREGKDDPDMLKIYEDRKEIATQMYVDAAEQEKAWATFLFKKGTMQGLNEKILGRYVEYVTNSSMKLIGLDPHYENHSHPLPWIESYFDTSSKQDAPQESENTSYLVGAVDTSIDENDMDDFKGFL